MKTSSQKFHRIEIIICLAIVCLASLFILAPLFHPGFFQSDDGEWMIIRLSAFFQSLRDGQFPVRFIGRLNHGYGYPVSNFLYPGFLYIGSFIHAFHVSFADSVKIILGGSVMGAGAFIFLWLRVYFSSWSSLFGAVSFLFAPYLVFDLYTRGSVGEVFAMMPAAAAFYAVASKKAWVLAPAIGLLVISHNTLAFLILPYLVLYALTIPQKYRLFSFLLGIGGAAFFWLPALVEKQYVQFGLTVVSRYTDYFLKGNELMLLGPLFLIALASGLAQRKSHFISRLHVAVFIISCFFALPVSDFFWRLVPIAPYVQFPFRFLSVGMIAGAYLVAGIMEKRSGKIQVALIGLAVIIVLTTVLPRVKSAVIVERAPGFYETNEDSTTVADEYMPLWVKVKPTQHTLRKTVMVKGLGTATLVRYSTRALEADVISQAGSTVILSTIYYPGWGVLVDDVPVPVRHNNERGLIEFEVPQGTHRVKAAFRETPLRLLADALSVVSVIGYLGCTYYVMRKKLI